MEIVEKLIDSLSNQHSLWDTKHPDYANKHIREKGFKQIASEIGMDVSFVQKKVRNLRTQFNAELKKEKDSLRSGAATDDIYKSKWKHFDSLLFLKGSVESDKTTSSLSISTNSSQDFNFSDDSLEISLEDVPRQSKKRKVKDEKLDILREETNALVKAIESASNNQQSNDSLTNWCLSLVDTLKLIDNPIKLEKTKIEIQQLILNKIDLTDNY
ncbi:hypothetical protein BLOT_006397 [Blomia tropicalis]|nr:hypothetical protein BLOT_006397 [Blomia tropicalis]